MTSGAERAVDRMMAAIEHNDPDEMGRVTADDMTVWHNFDGLVQTREDNLALLGGLGLVGRPRYRVLARVAAGDRVIQRHELTVTTWDGTTDYRLDVALFVTVRDDRIVAVEEYIDSAQVARLSEAIGRAGRDIAA